MNAIKKLALALLAAMAIASTIQAVRNAIVAPAAGNDFQWAPSRAVLHGVDPYAAYARGEVSWHHMAQWPVYPISGLVFLFPFAALDWPAAKALWAISNVAMTGWIIWLLSVPIARIGSEFGNQHGRGSIPWQSSLVMLAMLVSSMAWRNTMGKGQHGLFSLCFTLLAVATLHRNVAVSGLASALGWLKPTLGIPLSLFVGRTQLGLRALAISAATHAALTAGAALWVGSSIFDLMLGWVRAGQEATPRGRLDVFRIASDLGIEGPALPLVAAVAIAAVSFWIIRNEHDALSALSSLCFATLAVAFHSGYDFVIGVIPLAYAFRERFSHPRAWYLAAPFLLIWFAERPVLELVNRGWIEPAGLAAYGYHWLTVIVFYAAMVADWSHRFRFERAAAGTSEPRTGSA